jgi:hypothetical protein
MANDAKYEIVTTTTIQQLPESQSKHQDNSKSVSFDSDVLVYYYSYKKLSVYHRFRKKTLAWTLNTLSPFRLDYTNQLTTSIFRRFNTNTISETVEDNTKSNNINSHNSDG